MFKKNTAVTGFAFGLISSSDGSAVTTGTVSGFVTLDGGAQASIAGAITHEGNGQWSVDLTAGEMNGDVVGLAFTHASAIPAFFTIRTTTVLTSEVATAVDALRSGAGEHAVTVTVSDSSGVIQGARVSIVGTTLKDTTGSDGKAVFNLDAGSYSVRVSSPSGYADPSDTAVTVDGTEAVAITITATGTVTPPDDPLLSTLSVLCVDEAGAAEVGVTVEAKLVEIPSAGTGIAYTGVKQTGTSGADGVATLTLVRLAKYQVRRGTSDWSATVTIPDTGTSTVTSIIGAP